MADYANRTDLQNPAQKIARQAATGQPYGEASRQMAAQEAVPMGPSPTTAAPAPRPRPTPGQVASLTAPTERPSNHLLATRKHQPPPPCSQPVTR